MVFSEKTFPVDEDGVPVPRRPPTTYREQVAAMTKDMKILRAENARLKEVGLDDLRIEVQTLRETNAQLLKTIDMLKAERGPGIKPPEEPIVYVDNGWND
jgi:hypothetical protein